MCGAETEHPKRQHQDRRDEGLVFLSHFFVLFEAGFLCVIALAVLDSFCRPGQPPTHRHPPASALPPKSWDQRPALPRVAHLLIFKETFIHSCSSP